MKKIISFSLIVCILLISVFIFTGCENKEKNNNNLKIVTSFYPINIMALNITEGAKNIELSNMAEQNVGCLHNYTLNTSDLKKVEKANVFIKNGLEIENFMDKLLNSFSSLKVIDSSEGIENIIRDEDEENGHIWVSIDNNINQVKNIKDKLKELNSENSELYEKNAIQYIEKLEKLKQKYNDELGESLNGKKVVCLNEAFAYLINDLELDAIEVHTDHEESTLSAESVKNIIEKMKNDDIKIIIIDKNDNEKNAQNLSNETGAKIYKLDSCLTGDMDKDAYINSMEENLRILKQFNI